MIHAQRNFFQKDFSNATNASNMKRVLMDYPNENQMHPQNSNTNQKFINVTNPALKDIISTLVRRRIIDLVEPVLTLWPIIYGRMRDHQSDQKSDILNLYLDQGHPDDEIESVQHQIKE